MSKPVSPKSLSRRQTLDFFTPPVIIFLILVGGWYAVFGRGAKTIADIALGAANYLLVVLVSGGVALGYLAQWFSQRWNGLMQTPKTPWSISLVKGTEIQLASSDFQTLIPIEAVKKVTYVHDDNWDQLKGMEDSGLVVHLLEGGKIQIPGSSIGFHEALGKLRSLMEVESREVA